MTRRLAALTLGFVVIAGPVGCGCGEETPSADAITGDGTDAAPDFGPCVDGDTYCYGLVVWRCMDGTWVEGTDCSESGMLCDDDLGCVMCLPGRPYCEGETSMMCNEDGMGGTVEEDCTLSPNTWCDEASGVCIDECGQAALEKSNVGCEYWAVDLDNAENSMDDAAAGQFAVAVANVNNVYAADVWVYADTAGYGSPTVEVQVDYTAISPGMVHVFNLPRYDVDGPEVTPHYDDGPQTALSKRTFRVVSSVPVVAYQFNPIDQQFSNDASLLIPTAALGTLYHVVGWPPANPIKIAGLIQNPNRSYVTIVAAFDATHVTVTPTFDVEGSVPPIPAGFSGVAPMLAGNEYGFILNRYEVLNLENLEPAGLAAIATAKMDPTGTIVESDLPVAVYSGVDLAGVGGDLMPPGCIPHDPENDCSCCMEHLEMQVIPKVAMGKRFVVSHSAFRGSGHIEPDYYRVLAVRDGTHVVTSLGSFPTFDLNENEWYDFYSQTGFTLESTQPVQVVQLLVVREQTETYSGDPTMVPFPAVEERRSFYVFTTGLNFSEHWAVVSMPDGTTASIDGDDVASTCTRKLDGDLGGQTYYSYYCEIDESVQHTVDAGEQPVGVTVYGYYGAGSYGYPAGSDLREIFLE